jgi:CO dehydrogenase nickel-insertion accessory protein CooC1
MKISVCGKGGSGKSTIVTLLANEALARGYHVLVVEPPLESVEVAQKIHDLASGIGIKNVWGILNKVPSDEIATRLQTELRRRNIPVAGCLHFDPEVFSSSLEGRIPTNGAAAEEIKAVLDTILERVEV